MRDNLRGDYQRIDVGSCHKLGASDALIDSLHTYFDLHNRRWRDVPAERTKPWNAMAGNRRPGEGRILGIGSYNLILERVQGRGGCEMTLYCGGSMEN